MKNTNFLLLLFFTVIVFACTNTNTQTETIIEKFPIEGSLSAEARKIPPVAMHLTIYSYPEIIWFYIMAVKIPYSMFSHSPISNGNSLPESKGKGHKISINWREDCFYRLKKDSKYFPNPTENSKRYGYRILHYG